MKLSEQARIKLDELELQYSDDCKRILFQEARANNPYKIGDIIEDHCCTGKILRCIIGVSVPNRSFSIRYKCQRLTKAHKPYKNDQTVIIYSMNIKPINK